MNREGLTIGEILDRVEERRITPEEGYRLIEGLGGVNMDSGLSGANIELPESVYYRSAWEKSMYNEKDAKGQVIDDLVIFDTDVEFFRVIRQKAANSHRISLVLIGETFGKKEDGIYHINPSISEDYEKLTEDLTEQGIVPSHIIHRWSNSSLEHESLPLKDILERSIYSVFFLVKALMKKKLSNSIILYTYPVQENTDGDLGKMQPYHAAVSGFAKTLFMENPSFILKTIGICATSSGVQGEAAWAMGMLMNEFNASMPRELEIRMEDNVRYLRRLEEIKVIQGEHLLFRYRGVYLIAGGLGGLGFIFAKYLSGKLKARLVLTGRSSLNPESESKIRELESLGAEVVYMEGDIARREDVEKIADRVKALFNEINGVIHCAGVYRDGFIIRKTREDMEPVLAPKVYGAVNLDEVFEKENLDFFLLCSSMAGVTGKVGQCDYSYGNSFMDNYAKMRETLKNAGRRSGKSVSVNWPLWEEGGMKLSKDEQDMMNEQAGMEALPTTEGIKALEASLTASSHQMMVLYGSRNKIREYFSRNFFSGKEDAKPSAASVDTEIIRQKTEELLKGILAEEVGMSEESIDVNTNFEEYGIDSIIINQFNVHVEKKLGSLPKTLLFEYRNLRDMANFVANNYREQVVSNLGLGVKESQGGGDKTEPSVDLQWKTLKSMGESSRGKVNAKYGTPQESDADKGDIAIIGVSGRYPLADNLQEFWANMKNGRDCVTEIPVSRWDYRLYYDPETEKIKEGKMYCKWGGFINHIDTFDPLFFNISPREAEIMDPQERLFLEISWGALEDAGYTKSLLKRYAHGDIGPNVGVFVGVTSNTYQLLGAEQWGMGNRVITASTPWSVANRVSYLLNLSGPSVPVDTACSSALVSIHIACESLKKGECRMAIAGGVNLYMHPSKYVSMCQIKMLSRKGRCHSFGAEGDGFVPAEGVGAILLKPLKEAIDDGDRIYGVIKGTAINHGGKTSGYSVPNPNAQAEVISEAIKKSGISARTVSYIEAHGTGTALGDPIEIAGLTKAFSQYTLDKQFCSIGSVKSNVGHQESAAGIAGITKILLMMQHKMHVPSLHSKVLNPNIKFEDSPFVVQQELEEWKAPVVVE
ncbi:MAG: type I polyketide synthase, partial [Bacillota bacterium]|nr:type I polyketide synthase [Bacillota bacterium]